MKAEFEDILTSNQFLSWRHTNLQEITSPILSGITFHEWDAKHLPDEIIFSSSKFLIILHRFQMWNTSPEQKSSVYKLLNWHSKLEMLNYICF